MGIVIGLNVANTEEVLQTSRPCVTALAAEL